MGSRDKRKIRWGCTEAAKGGKRAKEGSNFYVAKPGPASSGWQCFPGYDNPGFDKIVMNVEQGNVNDPAFVEAMQVICEKKGYNSFNIKKDGKFVCIKNFSSPLAAEEGLRPSDYDFYLKK